MSAFDILWIISIGISVITIAYVIYILKFQKDDPGKSKVNKRVVGGGNNEKKRSR